jgi:transcriptional regulator with XRE-family HTH domain
VVRRRVGRGAATFWVRRSESLVQALRPYSDYATHSPHLSTFSFHLPHLSKYNLHTDHSNVACHLLTGVFVAKTLTTPKERRNWIQMPDSKKQRRRDPDLVALGKMIGGALSRQGLSARSVAQRADIDASHLSKVLRGDSSLRQQKLLALIDLLGLDRNKVFGLAGFAKVEKSPLDLGSVTLLRTLREPFSLNVVVTPNFYDSAVFMWMFSKQPLAEIGVHCQLHRADWGSVPDNLASYRYSVGFHGRRIVRRGIPVRVWSYLCLYTGYALIARGKEVTFEKMRDKLEELNRAGKKMVLVTIHEHAIDLLRRPLGNNAAAAIDLEPQPNPDVALDVFRMGLGDLYLGGLPQRLALRNADFSEIVTLNKEDEKRRRLYTLNALVCTQAMMEEKAALLHAIDALWYTTSRKLYTDQGFRETVFDEILELHERLQLERHSLVKSDFNHLFSEEGRQYEIFAQTPADLWEWVMEEGFELPFDPKFPDR